MNNSNKIKVKHSPLCNFCEPGKHHMIDPDNYPNDTKAVLTDQGWKCGNCIEREIQDKIIRVTPNSDRAKEIMAERAAKQKKELEFKRREVEIRKMYGT